MRTSSSRPSPRRSRSGVVTARTAAARLTGNRTLLHIQLLPERANAVAEDARLRVARRAAARRHRQRAALLRHGVETCARQLELELGEGALQRLEPDVRVLL